MPFKYAFNERIDDKQEKAGSQREVNQKLENISKNI
jgi:hypothetical protein